MVSSALFSHVLMLLLVERVSRFLHTSSPAHISTARRMGRGEVVLGVHGVSIT